MKHGSEPSPPPKPPAGPDRSARLAKALRDNLARRKAQKRARSNQATRTDKQE